MTVGLAVAALGLDVLRIRSKTVGELMARLVPVYRENEWHQISGGVWQMVGYAVAARFAPPVGAAAMLASAFADPAASLVGSRFGRHDGKSWQGSAACFLVVLVMVAVMGASPIASVGAAAAGTAVERLARRPFDDNLLLAPATAFTLLLLS
ncbi:MAG: hypothetical protein ACE5FJ_09235 [Gemmatimonadales bacterium]